MSCAQECLVEKIQRHFQGYSPRHNKNRVKIADISDSRPDRIAQHKTCRKPVFKLNDRSEPTTAAYAKKMRCTCHVSVPTKPVKPIATYTSTNQIAKSPAVHHMFVLQQKRFCKTKSIKTYSNSIFSQGVTIDPPCINIGRLERT